MKTGYTVSGIGHVVLILWLLIGGVFERPRDEPPLPVTDVSIISAEEFAALTAPPVAAPEVSPTPPPRPDPEPTPEPEPIAQPEPPAPEPALPSDEPPELTPDPTPPEADRVAPEIAPEPEPEADIAPDAAPEVAPADDPVAPPQEEQDATQPEAATTEIVTEAETPSALAPTASLRPQPRPNRPEPETAEPETADPEITPDAPRDPIADALADALDEAQDAPGVDSPPAPLGPPLTSAEQDGLRVAVSQCWNLGSTSTDAMKTTVVVLVDMDQSGRPTGIRLVSSNGPNQAATDTAFQAARRAIIRCATNGYNLPSEKYEQWREIEMTFNPENMRLR